MDKSRTKSHFSHNKSLFLHKRQVDLHKPRNGKNSIRHHAYPKTGNNFVPTQRLQGLAGRLFETIGHS